MKARSDGKGHLGGEVAVSPVEREAGRIAGLRAYVVPPDHAVADVELGERTDATMPALGLHAADRAMPTAVEVEWLRSLALDHVRIDISLDAADLGRLGRTGTDLARALAVDLEVALWWSGELDHQAIVRFTDSLPSRGVARVLVVRAPAMMASAEDVTCVQNELRSRGHRVPVYAAAGDNFVTLNRGWQNVGPADGVAFAVHPMVHADDDLSLIESLEGQAATVRSARAAAGDLSLAVSSIALERNGPEVAPDGRHDGAFAPCWILGSVAALAAAGASSATYVAFSGETGPLGPRVSADAPPLDRSLGDELFHVFRSLGLVRHGVIIETHLAATLPSVALAVRTADSDVILFANLAPRRTTLRIHGLSPGPAEVSVSGTSRGARRRLRPHDIPHFSPLSVGSDGGASVPLGPFCVASIRQAVG